MAHSAINNCPHGGSEWGLYLADRAKANPMAWHK